ncbi:hypothetical protein [Porphyromonas sp. oral taxon 275]|uniref:hypothetical protein n=1 Tax=Porphyromonas sp. oral taxon 275 TaxID=712435 RepID=UPI001BABD6E4|nr:hypothetical protein [Porphyromonas sp. oral taxon 275]QUB42577.1 hypothetical protein J4862_06115 [Porphyromonas sp. oral taxon 275]
MKIYDSQDQLLLDVEVDDSSVRYRAIKGEHSLTLKYSLAEHIELPRGAWCEYEGERYELLGPEAVKMQHTRHYDYTLTLEAQQSRLKLWKLRNLIDGRLKFPLTATPREHLQLLVNVLNERSGGGWTIGDCITEPERLISYDHNSCWEALAKLAEEFKTEWEITGKRISLRKVEHNKKQPLRLGYGKGRGLRSGLGRKAGEALPTEILWVQGGDRNIDRSRYGSATLHLPTSVTIAYDGEHFEDERGFDRLRAKRYKTDERGLSIRRADKPLTTATEASINAPDIYPSRVGSVTSVREVNATQHFWDFCDSTIPESLDYERCLIAGQTMTVIFQSGQLAGREFEVKYRHQGAAHSGRAARCFELIPQELDGVTMPSATFAPRVGDKYAVFHVMLPSAYINDRATRSGAEWELLRRCVRQLWEHEEQKYSYTAELDGLWAKKDWLNIGGRLILGGYVELHDERLAPEGVLLRIVGIKDSVNDPHSPIVELSNELVSAGLSGSILKLKDDEALVEEYHRSALQFTRRRFRDAAATAEALQSALLDKFTKSISPITLKTMQLLVGDESLQWRFVRTPRSNETFTPRIAWESERLVFTIEGATIQHQTLGITSLSSTHRPEEYRYWTMPSFQSPALTERQERYYVYARVEREGKVGSYRLEREARALESESGYYWLLVGLLEAAAADGSRSFARLYGFTEILPGQMRTERIASPDGDFLIDLVGKQIITPSLRFSSSGKSVEQIIEDKATDANRHADETVKRAREATRQEIEELKRHQRYSHTFDLSTLDSSKYYACIVWLSGTPYKNPNSARIRVYCGLGAAKAAPSYATNATGFGLQLEWTVNGEGFGGREAERVITGYQTRFVQQGEEVCSTPRQRTEISAEYVYLRGGYVYMMDVWAEQEPRGFFLAEAVWAADGYAERTIASPVTSVTPPKAIYRELRDSIDEGDKAALKGAKNYYDKEREKIDAKIDAKTRELAGRITSSDAKLLEAQQAMQGRYASLLEAQQAMQAELQRQIDKQVESHYGEQPPSGRYGWTAAEDAKHEGDTYTCRAPEGVTITPENAAQYPNVGKSWRFSRGGWVELADTDLTRALALAGQAKAAADGKVTHFRGDTIPTGYREGDLWTLTSAWNGFRKGSILTAVKDEVVGQYNPNHWREELRYTDDSAVRDLQLGGRNYAKGTAGVKEGSGYMVSEFRVGAPWAAGVDYTISFILGSEHNDMLVYLYVDGWSASDCAVRAEGTPTQGADSLYYARYSATFRTTEERIALSVKRIAGGNGGFRLYKTRRAGASDQGRYVLSRVMLERGNKPSDWSPAPEDTDEAISKEGQEGRKYTEGKTKEAKDYADTKTKEAKDEAAKKAKEQDGKLKTLEEARAEQAKALQQLGVRLEGQGEELKAAQRGLESYRYLTEVLGKGDTLISGGLVLSNIIAARDSTGGIRSWVSGLIKDKHGRNYPAFAAGVTGYGTASERRIVEINHDGSGHFGLMYIDDNGRVLRFRPEGSKAGEVLRIGGEQPSLEQLLAQRPFSAALRHSGGFDRRNLAETLGAELWRSSEKFYAPMGAHLSYRMSVRGLRCFITGGDPAVYPDMRPEEWDTDVVLTFSLWRSGDSFDPVAEVTRDVGANASMGEREQSVEDVHLELDLPTTDTYYTKVTATRKKLYHVTASSKEQVDKVPSGLEVVLELTVQECTGTVRKASDVDQETVISTRGISVVESAQRLFLVNSSSDSSSPVLAVRGRTDVPGILAAAEIKVHPRLEIANRWGMHATRLKVERIGGGRYRVTHLLNRLDYIVQLTPYANGYGGMAVENKRASSFEVVTYDRTSGTDGTPFALTIIGDNA